MAPRGPRGRPRSSSTLTERIANELRTELMRGDIAPGSAIKAGHVAERFATSRIPVRDALARLAAEGLVEMEPNKQARAALLDFDDLFERYEIRAELEALAVSKSVSNGSPDGLSAIREARLWAEKCQDDIEESIVADEAFHMACYAPSGSKHLMGLIEGLWRETRVYRMANWRTVSVEDKAAAFDEHLMIEETFRRQQPEVASALIRAHLRRTRDRFASHPPLVGRQLPEKAG